MKALSTVQTLLLSVLALSLAVVVYFYLQESLTQSQTAMDPFLRYAKLSESYLKVVSASYELKTGLIAVHLQVQNTFDEPIYYKAPLYVYVVGENESGQRIFRIPVNNSGSVSFFQPKVLVSLDGTGPFDTSYIVVRAYLSVNGVPIYFQPKTASIFREPDAYCHDCVTCQSLIDHWKTVKSNAYVALDANMEVNKDPCISLNGNGNDLLFDCLVYSASSHGGTFLEVNGSNFKVRSCTDVRGFDTAVLVKNTSSVSVHTLITDVPNVVYVENPLSTSSYDIYLVDVGKGDRKLYQYRSGATTVYPPYYPLAIWVYDYSGPLSLELNNGILDSVEPPLAILNSTDLDVNDVNIQVSYPYGVVVLNSQDVSFNGGSISVSGGACALCVSNSTGISISNLSISSSSLQDVNLFLTDANIYDLNVG